MNDITLKGRIEERVSNKTGVLYKCLILNIGGYEKIVFLNPAELVLLERK